MHSLIMLTINLNYPGRFLVSGGKQVLCLRFVYMKACVLCVAECPPPPQSNLSLAWTINLIPSLNPTPRP